MNRIYQCITNNNNAGYVADVSFWEFGSIFGAFKQTFGKYSACGSKDVAMRTC